MSELEAVILTYYGHCPFKLQGWGSWWRLSGSGSDPPEQKPNTDPSLKKNNLWMRLRPEEFTHNFLFSSILISDIYFSTSFVNIGRKGRYYRDFLSGSELFENQDSGPTKS